MVELTGVEELKALESGKSDALAKADAERDRLANLRAQAKAAFVKYDSASGIPFTRGQAVMVCLNCESLIVGAKKIKQHAERCRRK